MELEREEFYSLLIRKVEGVAIDKRGEDTNA